ncbi:D-alanine--D-alanine ligase [Canibacter sp. lx-72]|uniref:D-alanine--D-alanine ligase family protein n=1 Tax=Canibacter zhuwentaonis TaxID=2837491 RepID=UPI001BDD9D88|nr:D-alanine--D-alanine ligase family protein [Canibacter zhuwentaonis]MBT1018184.1 D-alanine--D-alanine ligase [Canibacter zhuwentaonis]
MSSKKTVALIFGGRSSEHGISCVTAASVYSAIDKNAYDVVCVGITKLGEFVPVSVAALQTFRLDSEFLPEIVKGDEELIFPLSTNDHRLRLLNKAGTVETLAHLDVALIMMHGRFGEDGTVQGLCELAGLPYTGSGSFASALCMDKHAAKLVLQTCGVRVAPWQLVTRAEFAGGLAGARDLDAGLSYPLFVKPAREGSSVGVTRVSAPADLPVAIETALAADKTALLESAVIGREVEIGVLERRDGSVPLTSSVIGEIVFNGRDFYDFEAKYMGAAGADVVLPADVTVAEYQQLKDAALRAFEATGCAGYARVDFFLTDSGPVLNEINTLPGFTPISMYPQLMCESGVDYTALITELIELGLCADR